MRSLRRRVFAYDVNRWSSNFLDQLAHSAARREALPTAAASHEALARAEAALCAAPSLVLLLDYDGTLVRLAATPELATPDDDLIALLAGLAARPGTTVHLVSGRARDELEQWFGHLPVGLHAEHGQWSRAPDGVWVGAEVPAGTWRERAAEILEDFAARTPGSLVERKRSGLAWHYRMADPEYGALQANELKLHLTSLLSNALVEHLRARRSQDGAERGGHDRHGGEAPEHGADLFDGAEPEPGAARGVADTEGPVPARDGGEEVLVGGVIAEGRHRHAAEVGGERRGDGAPLVGAVRTELDHLVAREELDERVGEERREVELELVGLERAVLRVGHAVVPRAAPRARRADGRQRRPPRCDRCAA